MITAKSIISTNYMLDLPAEKLIRIMRKDSSCYTPLHIILGNIKGMFSVDYDGHFGPHIFFSIEIEDDNKETWDLIYKTIENYL